MKNQKGIINLVLVGVIIVLVALSSYLFLSKKTAPGVLTEQTTQQSEQTVTQATTQSTVFSNQYLTLNVLSGWKATQPSSVSQSVNIVKGNYILYINPLFGHASGVEGGRFSEITNGMPGVGAVVTKQGMADGYTCSNLPYDSSVNITNKLVLKNLYTASSIQNNEGDCNLPSDGQSAWFGAFSSGSASDVFNRSTAPDVFNEYAITVAYNTTDVNKLPKKDSPELTQILNDVSAMLKTLKLKSIPISTSPVTISSVSPSSDVFDSTGNTPDETITIKGSGFTSTNNEIVFIRGTTPQTIPNQTGKFEANSIEGAAYGPTVYISIGVSSNGTLISSIVNSSQQTNSSHSYILSCGGGGGAGDGWRCTPVSLVAGSYEVYVKNANGDVSNGLPFIVR